MLRLIRWIIGWLEFTIEGDCGLFLNRTRKGIWRVRSQSNILRAKCAMKDYKGITKIAKRSGCRVRIVKKRGLPIYIRKYKLRTGIVAGIITIISLFFVSSLFVWDVNINGNTIIPTKDILKLAHENGLHKGSMIGFIDLSEIKYKLQDKFPQIAWTSINRTGNKYIIEISEIEPKPQEVDSKTPCNVVSNYDGIILLVEPYDGFEKVKAGDVVKKDDLLVSGIKEYEESGQVLFAHAKAKVIAQVVRDAEFTVPLKQLEEFQEEKTIEKKKLLLFGLKFPLYFKLPNEDEYNKDTQEENLSILGFKIPITIEKTTYTTNKEKKLSGFNLEEIKRELVLKAQKWEEENLKSTKITQREYKYKNEGSRIKLEIKDTVEQRIDKQLPIIITQDENIN